MSLKLIVWNCNGAISEVVDAVMNTSKVLNVSVIILTETHRGIAHPKLAGWKVISTPPQSTIKRANNGVIILHRSDIKITNVTLDPMARFITCQLTKSLRTYKLAAIYAPAQSSEKSKFWSSKMALNILSKHDIVCGDFNMVLDPIRDSNNPLRRDLNLKALENVQKGLKLMSDIALIAQDLSPTYKDISRIDRIYINEKVLSVRKYFVTSTTLNKDHQLLYASLMPIKTSEPTYWRFRHYLLVDEEDKVLASQILETEGVDWKETKVEIQAQLQLLEKKLLRKRKKALYISKALLKSFPGSRNAAKWKACLALYRKLVQKAERLWIRIKATTSRELPSSWLTAKLKKRGAKNTVSEAINSRTGELSTSPESLTEAFRVFYEDLYKETIYSKADLQSLLVNWVPPIIDNRELGLQFSVEELADAINQSAAKKSPGIDGITNTAYKLMSSSAKNLLLRDINSFMLSENIPADWKKGIIILLFKKGEKNDPANYRPITLLNCDYKLLCKMMANRLNKIIKDYIPNYQIGFMPGRLIYDNILCLDIALKENNLALVLDFMKAYDTVGHKPLCDILTHLRLPDKFISLIRAMLQGSTATILVNDLVSKELSIKRGVKQGDPLSPLLFSFAVELLGYAPTAFTEHIPTVKGVYLPRLMYADDTVLFSKSSEGIKSWIDDLKVLEKAIGLKIHADKTFLIGTEEIISGIEPLHDVSSRYLGFEVGKSGVVNNFDSKLNENIDRLKKWSNKGWNIFTKISVLRTYCDSALTFFAFLMSKISKDLAAARKNFIWGSRVPSVSKKRILLPWHLGGCGLVDDDVRYKALRTKMGERILFDKDMKIHQMLFKSLPEGTIPSSFISNENKFPEMGSILVDNILSEWIKYSPNHCITHSAKQIQKSIIHQSGNDLPLWTPRQLFFAREGTVDLPFIFTSVKSFPHLKLRYFMWRYFQGALPFNHRELCKRCAKPYSHNHIFIKCSQATPHWEMAFRVVDLLYNTKTKNSVRTNLICSESNIWKIWSDPILNPFKTIVAVTLQSIWYDRSNKPIGSLRNPKFKFVIPPFEQLLKESVQDSIDVTKMIRSTIKRNEQLAFIQQSWRLSSPIWYNLLGSNELQSNAIAFIRQGNDSPDGLNLFRRLLKLDHQKTVRWVPELLSSLPLFFKDQLLT